MAAGGFKMSLGSLKAKPGLKAVAAKDTKPKKALLGDDEPEDANKQQEISGFDSAGGGAIGIDGPKEKKGPLVIPSLPNRNWREEARKKQLERAPHTQQNRDVIMDEPEKEVVYGLTVPTKPSESQENGDLESAEPMEIDPQENLTEAQRLEKQALESLLNGKSTDASRIVPAITDEEALQNDLNDAPDEPSLDAYEATPIEGFGLAMLRGMGWKDSDGETRKNGAKAPKEVKRRPALLGIGAKEDAAKDVELGEFNSKVRGKNGKRKDAPQGYTPVTLRNKKTGEVITEEELKAKLESQDLVQDEKSARESRRRDDGDGDDEKSERRRDRRDDRDRDRDRRRNGDYDSEQRHNRDRKDDRRRDKYDDDSDRRREKRRDRDREDDYESERRREKRRDRDRRDRSRSPRDDKRRDRYRSRSRDTKDRRDRRDRSRSRDEEDRRRRRKEKDYDNGRDERRRYKDEKSSRS